MINSFLKKWHKNRLLQKIYKLKELAVTQKSSAESAKLSADSLTNYIATCQRYAESGDPSSLVYLDTYLTKYLHQIEQHQANYALYNQQYLNTLDEIKHLNDLLNR